MGYIHSNLHFSDGSRSDRLLRAFKNQWQVVPVSGKVFCCNINSFDGRNHLLIPADYGGGVKWVGGDDERHDERSYRDLPYRRGEFQMLHPNASGFR